MSAEIVCNSDNCVMIYDRKNHDMKCPRCGMRAYTNSEWFLQKKKEAYWKARRLSCGAGI